MLGERHGGPCTSAVTPTWLPCLPAGCTTPRARVSVRPAARVVGRVPTGRLRAAKGVRRRDGLTPSAFPRVGTLRSCRRPGPSERCCRLQTQGARRRCLSLPARSPGPHCPPVHPGARGRLVISRVRQVPPDACCTSTALISIFLQLETSALPLLKPCGSDTRQSLQRAVGVHVSEQTQKHTRHPQIGASACLTHGGTEGA